MGRRTKWIRVVAFGALAFALLIAGETTQAIAENFLAGHEREMIAFVNAHRENHDRTRLATSPDLRITARKHSQRMSAEGMIYHDIRTSQREADRRIPGNSGLWENVGRGGDSAGVYRRFIASSGHHANIDGKPINITGVGAIAGDDGWIYFTQHFTRHRSAKKLRKQEARREREERERREERRREREEREREEERERDEASPSPAPSPSASPGASIVSLPAEVLGCRFIAGGVSEPCPGPAPPVAATPPAAEERDVSLARVLGAMFGRSMSNIAEGLGRLAFWR